MDMFSHDSKGMLFPKSLSQEKADTLREEIELYPTWIFPPVWERQVQYFTQNHIYCMFCGWLSVFKTLSEETFRSLWGQELFTPS